MAECLHKTPPPPAEKKTTKDSFGPNYHPLNPDEA